MRVLIIKLTSMGDLMHAFPAITDMAARYPDLSVDWVVDESFAEVPLWHPSVKRVMTTAHRRWKKNILSCWSRGEFKDFYHALNADNYDVIVDLQSNLKSAVVSWLRKGNVHGYDRKTCREKPAHWAYGQHYHVGLRQHAIERQRELMAKILGYTKPDTESSYGVDLQACQLPAITLPEKYVVLVHNASWPTKLWPEEYWQQLIEKIAAAGYKALLPCGSQQEHERAQRIADQHRAAIALPKMNLNQMAAVMQNAQAAVCSDTGLAHMSAVTGTPSITLYAVTDTLLIGTVGRNQQHIVADKQSLNASMQDITVEHVWQQLQTLL